jgi:YidC/Oxa1 family membrane protein insertase
VQEIITLLGYVVYFPIFNILMFLYWVVRDFGLSIVLLTLMVRLAMVPLTFKQLHSQRKLMELQPQINALKAQYGADQQGFARAQMQLMKENNVSMLGGCLPLLIQLPFLYGLFAALRSGLGNGNPNDLKNIDTVNSNLYPFMKFASVTGPHGSHPLDTYLNWFGWLGLHLNLNAPDPSHILPILAAFFTLISVRMMQRKTPPTPGTDPKTIAQQNAQQQTMGLMTYITPLITLWFGWQYAAGLSLYWTVGTLFSIGQTYYIYGWGGLFKSIPRLEQWAERKNAEHQARRDAKLIARGVISAPSVVESSLATANGATRNGAGSASKNGARQKDWIDQAKGETPQSSKGKERAITARPFPTLMKSKETAAESAPKGASSASAQAANGSKAEARTGSGAINGSKNGTSGRVGSTKGTTPATTAKTGTPGQRKVPPRSGTLPKPKGGKK